MQTNYFFYLIYSSQPPYLIFYKAIPSFAKSIIRKKRCKKDNNIEELQENAGRPGILEVGNQ